MTRAVGARRNKSRYAGTGSIGGRSQDRSVVAIDAADVARARAHAGDNPEYPTADNEDDVAMLSPTRLSEDDDECSPREAPSENASPADAEGDGRGTEGVGRAGEHLAGADTCVGVDAEDDDVTPSNGGPSSQRTQRSDGNSQGDSTVGHESAAAIAHMTVADVALATICDTEEDGPGEGAGSTDDEDRAAERAGITYVGVNYPRSQYLRRGVGLMNVLPRTLWALLLTHGSRRYTVDMYECVRKLHKHTCDSVLESASDVAGLSDAEKTAIRREHRLPHVRTLVRKLRPVVLDDLAVPVHKLSVPIDMSAPGARMAAGGRHCRVTAPVHYTSILDYACADIASNSFLDELQRNESTYGTEHEHDVRGQCDDAPIVRNREFAYGPTCTVDVSYDSTQGGDEKYAEVGDVVQVFLGITEKGRVATNLWGGDKRVATYVYGRIVTIFDIRHWDDDSNWSTDGSTLARDQEEELWKGAIGALWYEWTEKTALRKKTPLLQPGDCVAVLRPVVVQNSTERVLLVNRFVRGVNERARFLILTNVHRVRQFLGPRTSGKHTVARAEKIALPLRCSSKITLMVRSLALAIKHGGERQSKMTRTAPTFGSLEDGQPYVVYRCCLYVDGFHVYNSQEGSAEGIYLQPLGVRAEVRKDERSLRILSIVPPGAPLAPLLNQQLHSAAAGMTEGRVVVDAYGIERRVFIDVVGVFGDTPAEDSMLDVVGHRGRACCHRCTFDHREANPLENGYLGAHGTWGATAWRRTLLRHRAARFMKAPPVVLKHLGIAREMNELTHVWHSWADRVVRVRNLVPLTKENVPVVPTNFCPYGAHFVTPDHLLAGHFRDLLVAALNTFPAVDDRRRFETALLAMAWGARYSEQNRVFDVEERRVLSMSMSDAYSLVPFSHQAFRLTHADVLANANGNDRAHLMYRALRTGAALVHGIWTGRLLVPKATPAARKRAMERALLIRRDNLYAQHFLALRCLCTVSKEEQCALLDDEDNVIMNASTPQNLRFAYYAVRALSKPNTHRLRELHIQLRDLWPHAVWFSELSLERGHQRVKAILEHTNHHDEHVLAMNGARFSDWQGRLHECLTREDGLPAVDVLGGVRTLGGSAALRKLQSEHKPGADILEMERKVRRLLAPDSLVRQELENHAPLTLSPQCLAECPRKVRVDKSSRVYLLLGDSAQRRADKVLVSGDAQLDTHRRAVAYSAAHVSCLCKHCRSRWVAGDIIVRLAPELPYHTSDDAPQYGYYRIVAFAMDEDQEGDCLAAVQRMFVREVDGELYGVVFTRSIRVLLVKPNDVIWRATHDCAAGKCDIHSNARCIRHTRAVLATGPLAAASQSGRTTDVYRLLTWATGYPPRSG